LIMLAGSISFLGFGIMAAVMPLLFPERGEEMTFVISSILLLVSGVYYPIAVLPDWMEPLAKISPATYVLEGMRATLLDGAPTTALGPFLMPIIILGALAVPLGIAIFGWAERYAKRTGRLKRAG
jgi:ABC-2 type transport system permease protein